MIWQYRIKFISTKLETGARYKCEGESANQMLCLSSSSSSGPTCTMMRDLTSPRDLYRFLMSSILLTLMTYAFSSARINCNEVATLNHYNYVQDAAPALNYY